MAAGKEKTSEKKIKHFIFTEQNYFLLKYLYKLKSYSKSLMYS